MPSALPLPSSDARECELRLCSAAECGDAYEVLRLLATGTAIDCTNDVRRRRSTREQR